MQELRDALAERLDEAEWEWLAPHARRSALFVVDGDLDLLDVGVAIANDNVSSVERWIHQQLLYKPSQQQLSDWESDRSQRFRALIVQPFVLVQFM
ncbi:MAG: DUF2288 family protein [Leptolyngbyaceae cyanobacterium SL_7_1]|nr:DUF2288 family protein [Leptolyngbyaceae cyanobacterium SL_7_1]